MYNFEINITTHGCLHSTDILTILDNLGCKIDSAKRVVDNKFDSMTEISISEMSNIDPADENILVIFQATRNNVPCGAIISKSIEGFLCSLWFECDDGSKMDSDSINELNADKYYEAIEFVYDAFRHFSIMHASFGCEMRISDDTNLADKIEKSTALAWLVPNDLFEKTPTAYDIYKFGEQYSVILKSV